MRIKDRISEITKLQEELNNELVLLRETCTHDEYYIGLYSWRIGAYNIVKLCNECSINLGDPSQEEIEVFNNSI